MSDSQDLIQFLTAEVWPFLDGVEAGMLDELNPKARGRSGFYDLDCPVCRKPRRAFYRRGGFITCNRESQCGASISVYHYLLSEKGFGKKEALEACASAVGKSLPDGNSRPTDPGTVLMRACRSALLSNESLLAYLEEWRGLSRDYLSQLPVGYIPSVDFLFETFKSARVRFSDAQEMGLLPMPKDAPKKNNAFLFSNRLVGFWKGSDNHTGMWGRSLPGYGETRGDQKYLFTSGIEKSMPWLFSPRTVHNVGIEGPLDAAAMRALGFNAHALGGSHYIRSQVETLAAHHVTHTTHMADGDVAGLLGGFKSVLNGLACDVRISVAPLAEGLDDPDALREKKRPDLTLRAVEAKHPPGEFLALAVLRARRDPNPKMDPDDLQRQAEQALAQTQFSDVVSDYWGTYRKLGA